MSSQESAAMLSQQQPPQQQPRQSSNASKKKRRVVKKRRRAAPAPPGRLGWLGDGMAKTTSMSATGNDADENDNDNGNSADENNNDSGGRLLTPRPDFHHVASNNNSAPPATATAIDLTGDNDEFTFRESPIQSNVMKSKQRSKHANASDNDNDNEEEEKINNANDVAAGDSISEQWECRKCTFLNFQNCSHCTMCDSRRESIRRNENSKPSLARSAPSTSRGNSSSSNDGIKGRISRTRTTSRTQKLKKSGSENEMIDKEDQKKQHKHNHNRDKRKPTDMERKMNSQSKQSQSLLKWTSASASSKSKSQKSSTQTKSSSFAQHSFARSYASNTKSKKSKLLSTTKNLPKANSKAIISTEMWIDKHAPETSKELCVAPKKIEQVKQFLSCHLEYMQSQREQNQQKQQPSSSNYAVHQNPWDVPSNYSTPLSPPQTKLMILVGSPGIGKSTTIRTLAKEMQLEVLTWNDLQLDYNMQSSPQTALDGGGYLPYQSQLSSFEEFLMQGGVGVQSLELGGINASDDSSEEDVRIAKRGKDENKSHHDGSLILIEEIPNLYNEQAAQSFRNVMERHIQRTQTPTFFIFSDVHEGKHKPDDLERLIPSRILYSPLVQILPIQSVTKAKMKKCLQNIAKAEGLGSGSRSSSLTPEFFEETHLSSGGDLRNAIFAMQFLCSNHHSNASSKSKNKCTSNDNNYQSSGGGKNKKDAKLSTFHALGKLLYAKRKQQPQESFQQYDSDDDSTTAATTKAALANAKKWDDKRGQLAFIPEDILNNIDMGIGSSITFVSYHSPDFFTDITDLSRSFDLLSDASTFLDQYYGQSDNGQGPFPNEYAACIGGRAVADGNKHPAPPQFRQFVSPKVFGVMKKNRENEVKIGYLRKRLSVGGGGGGQSRISIHDTVGSARQFVTDSLPYMRSVIPEDVNHALANLHSYAKDSNNDGQASSSNDQIVVEEENKVLLEDDLVDDDNEEGW